MADLRLGSMVIEDHGHGAPVVMVHGLGGSSASFETLMDVCRGHRILRPDLPGAGRSPLRPGRPGLDGLVANLADTLQLAGVSSAHFVGHSMGTLVCQHLAAQRPDLVTGLVLFGPILDPPAAARVALKDRANTARKFGMAGIADAVCAASVSEATIKKNPAAGAFVRQSLLAQDPLGYAAHCDALSDAHAADHGSIRCPVLLVAGAADPVAPVVNARQLAEKIGHTHLEIIPDCGHWMMVEAPECSARYLQAHLDRTASGKLPTTEECNG